jgi:hypothetical protein
VSTIRRLCVRPPLPTLMDHAPVLWRHRRQQAIWRLAAASLRGFRRTLDGQGFTEIHTPKLVASSTESHSLTRPGPACASRGTSLRCLRADMQRAVPNQRWAARRLADGVGDWLGCHFVLL